MECRDLCPPAADSLRPDGRLQPRPFPHVARTTVHVDSRDRDYDKFPSSSDFAITMPEPLHNVSSAVLVSAEIPLSYYVFSQARGNTSLSYLLSSADPNDVTTVTIPDGNYTAVALVSTLKALLGGTFDVSYSANTMKCTVSATGTSLRIMPSTNPKATEWGLAYYLGFPKAGATTTTPSAGGVVSLTGTSVISLNPENYLLLDIEGLNGLHQSAMYSGGSGGRKTFAKVPLLGDSYQYNFYDKTVSYVAVRPQLTKVERLRFGLRFHDGTAVDLNGAEWSCSIEFAHNLARAL
jgi:hypothetical protein